jgi:hypothetical protein
VPGNAGPGQEPSQVYGNALYAPRARKILTPNVSTEDAFRKPAQTEQFAWPIPKPAPNFAIFAQRFSVRRPTYHSLISLKTYSAKPSELLWGQRGCESRQIKLAILGRLDEARSAIQAGLALNPTFAVSRFRAVWTAVSDDPTYLAQLEPIVEGLRKAGVPEQ